MQTEEKRGKKQWERRERNFKETTLLFHRLGEGLKLSVFTTLLAGLLAAPIVDSLHGRFLAPAPCQQLSLAPLSPPVEWVSRNSFIVHCYILPSIRCSVFVGLRHREDAVMNGFWRMLCEEKDDVGLIMFFGKESLKITIVIAQ